MDSLAKQGTPDVGYEEKGPYHCEDCVHLASGNTCMHPKVVAAPSMKARLTADGKGVRVNAERGCCEYVNQTGHREGNDHDTDDEKKKPKWASAFDLAYRRKHA